MHRGSDGDVGKSADAAPCTLYALRDQHTLQVLKAPGSIDPRSRWEQGEHWHQWGAIGRAPRSRM